MSVETLHQPEEIPENWQRAIDNAPFIVRGLYPQLSEVDQAGQVDAIEDTLRDFIGSESLKVVSYTDPQGEGHRTIEPSWSETDGFGLPVDTFAGLMGLDNTHMYAYGDLTDGRLLASLARVTQKPISAFDQGHYIDPVLPQQ